MWFPCLKFYIIICRLLISILIQTEKIEYLLKSQFPTCEKSFIEQPAKKHCKTKNNNREGWMPITKISVQKHINLMFIYTSGHQFTWWVPVKGGEAPWRAGRSRVYASGSAAHWTWDADGSGSNKFLPPKESFALVCAGMYLLQWASPIVE